MIAFIFVSLTAMNVSDCKAVPVFRRSSGDNPAACSDRGIRIVAGIIANGTVVISANPDLVRRWQTGAVLNTPDPSTFYTPGPRGYTDYPTLT